jgi:hypothetical protein
VIPPLQLDSLEPLLDLDEHFLSTDEHFLSTTFPPESFSSPCYLQSFIEPLLPPKTLQPDPLGCFLLELQQDVEKFEHLTQDLYENGLPHPILHFWSLFRKSEDPKEILRQFSQTEGFTPEFVQISALLGSFFVKHLIDCCPEKLQERIEEPLDVFPHYMLHKMEVSDKNLLTFFLFIQQPEILHKVLFSVGSTFYDLLHIHPNFRPKILKNLEALGFTRGQILNNLRLWTKTRPRFDRSTQDRLSEIFDQEMGYIGYWLLTRQQENIFLQDSIPFSKEGLELILFETKQGLNQFQEALPILLNPSSKIGSQIYANVISLLKIHLETVLKRLHPVDHDRLLRFALLKHKGGFSQKLVSLIQSGNFLWSNVASFFFSILLNDLSKEDQFLLITEPDREGYFLFNSCLLWLNLKPCAKMHLIKEISTTADINLQSVLKIVESPILTKEEKIKICKLQRIEAFIRDLPSVTQEKIFKDIDRDRPQHPQKKKKKSSYDED